MREQPDSVDAADRTTVVIATRDRRAELLRTLEELESANPRAPVIVVDNASADGTAEAVVEHHPAVRVLRLTANRGAAARNVGVLCARTPYVAFSDDDSWWHPEALREAESLLDEHTSVGLIAARTLVGPRGNADPVAELMRTSPLGTSPGLPGPSVLGFTACAAVVRRSAFLEAGGFSPVLFFVAEEKLLAYDLCACGWDLVYVDSVVAYHRPARYRHDDSTRAALERRNNVLIAWMRRRLPVAARSTVELLTDARRDRVARHAFAGVARRAPAALRARRRLPPSVERKVSRLEDEHQH